MTPFMLTTEFSPHGVGAYNLPCYTAQDWPRRILGYWVCGGREGMNRLYYKDRNIGRTVLPVAMWSGAVALFFA